MRNIVIQSNNVLAKKLRNSDSTAGCVCARDVRSMLRKYVTVSSMCTCSSARSKEEACQKVREVWHSLRRLQIRTSKEVLVRLGTGP
jgi:hypothetical protein